MKNKQPKKYYEIPHIKGFILILTFFIILTLCWLFMTASPLVAVLYMFHKTGENVYFYGLLAYLFILPMTVLGGYSLVKFFINNIYNYEWYDDPEIGEGGF